MRLYVVRHGKAERQSGSGRDEDRELSPRGRRQAEWLGERLREGGSPPARVIASPAARAAATAALLAAALDIEPEPDAGVGLGTLPSRVVALIAGVGAAPGGVRSLAVVGHNPTLSVVVNTLLHGPTGSGPAGPSIGLRTGEAAVLDLPELVAAGERVAAGDLIGTATLLDMLRLDD